MSENISRTGVNYVGIDRAGTASLYKVDAIKEFTGFPDSLNNRYNASLVFTPDSEAEFNKRVSSPLATIAADLDFTLYLAGRDFRAHSTLLEGEYKGADVGERRKIFDRVASTNAVSRLTELSGKTVEYKYLLVGGTLILTAIDIPDWVLETRTRLWAAYENEGLTPPAAMKDILHITVARITGLSTQDRMEKLKIFGQKVQEVRHTISGDPLVLEVDRVSTVPPLELLNNKP